MTALLPAEITSRRVVARYLNLVADSEADPDFLPDGAIPAGDVRFSRVEDGRVWDDTTQSDGTTVRIAKGPIVAKIDPSTGEIGLAHDPAHGVKLPVGLWSVEERVAGRPAKPWVLDVTAGEGVIDLHVQAPVVPTPTTVLVPSLETMERAEAAADRAETAEGLSRTHAQNASASAQAASEAQGQAQAAASSASSAASSAATSESNAGASASAAVGSESAAAGSADSAASSASAAASSAGAASSSATAAGGHATDAEDALTATVEARDLTLGYRDTAAGHATTATEQAGLATTARTGAEAARDGAVSAMPHIIVGAGRPDIPGTLTPDIATRVTNATSGTVFRSTDGPQGAWEWMKRGTSWVCVEGDTGLLTLAEWSASGDYTTGSPDVFLSNVGPVAGYAGGIYARRTGAGAIILLRALKLTPGKTEGSISIPTGWLANHHTASITYGPLVGAVNSGFWGAIGGRLLLRSTSGAYFADASEWSAAVAHQPIPNPAWPTTLPA